MRNEECKKARMNCKKIKAYSMHHILIFLTMLDIYHNKEKSKVESKGQKSK